MKLGVNIDHIATIREARGTSYPSVVEAAYLAEKAGADSITLHLREDRRHMQDADLYELKPLLKTKMNLELAPTQEMIDIALDVSPQDVCFVPERREERTTEGGLDVIGQFNNIKSACEQLLNKGIRVSLFIAPSVDQIQKAIDIGVPVIEIHTGSYADLENNLVLRNNELEQIKKATDFAQANSLVVNAGHGLHYNNVHEIAALKKINELNIGHAIVAEALFIGWENAVKKMKVFIDEAAKK